MLAMLQELGLSWTALDERISAYFAVFGIGGEMLVRLVLAAFLGAIVGIERELRGHQAGMRTFMLVTVGATIAMLVSWSFAYQQWPSVGESNQITIDPARVAYGVMTGVGFLGAGNILQNRSQVRGLTTAAGIWATAAIGLAVGNGLYLLAATATVLMLVVFSGLHFAERHLGPGQRGEMTFLVPWNNEVDQSIRDKLKASGARITSSRISRKPGGSEAELELRIVFKRHRRISQMLAALEKQPDIELITWRRT
ncbi:MAG: MgtC/SapB family protein [Planctomycetota bacterium]